MTSDTLISGIRAASREMVRQFGLLSNPFASIGSPSQCHALVELDAHGIMNIRELSIALNLEKSTTSRLMTQLILKGLCRIHLGENDRRNKLISLTEKGSLLANKIHAEAKLQVQQALGTMNEEEQNLVARGLSLYAKALKRSRLKNEYSIRNLLKRDVPSLKNLIKNVWKEFGFDSNHPNALIFEKELNRIYETYAGQKSAYFVLTQGKKIVGGGGFTPLYDTLDPICEIKGMYLSPHLRGLGLGTLLLKKILETSKKDGFKKCYLETMDFMQIANSLYTKLGFSLLDKPLGNTGHTWTNCWYLKEI